MNKAVLIRSLAGTQPQSVLVKERQSVDDIMRRMQLKHEETAADYDKIYKYFEGGDIWDVSERLWNFCKDQMTYKVETEAAQYVSCPYTILTGGKVDCKNYSLFIAGVLDAMKRAGSDISWKFRFASYNPLDPVPGHVFVVVNPKQENIWIDPVLDSFNDHMFYWWKKDRKVDTAAAAMGSVYGRIGSQEDDLLSYLKQYELGLVQSVANIKKGQIDQATDDILKGALESAVPGADEAFAIASKVQTGVAQTFGAGSILTRVVSAGMTGNPLNLINAIFNGRTYNQDQYFGASDYSFYVKGKDVGASTNISDAMVLEALKWFIKKTGVFVSGRIHINALRQGVDEYMALHSVNSYTTMDRVRVQLAVNVVQRYMPANKVLYEWAGTVGVYDLAVTAAIEAARIADPNAQTDTQGIVTTGLTGGRNYFLIAVLAAIGIYVLSEN